MPNFSEPLNDLFFFLLYMLESLCDAVIFREVSGLTRRGIFDSDIMRRGVIRLDLFLFSRVKGFPPLATYLQIFFTPNR
jgi:hypothetical protein